MTAPSTCTATAKVVAPRHVFQLETDLASFVEQWLRSQGASCVAHEVEAGFGVPDLMGGIGSAAALRARRRLAAPIPDSLQLRLLQFCQRPRSVDELRRWAPTGFSTLRKRALEPLVEALLLRLEDAAVSAVVDLTVPFETTVAVELKLRPSKRGLRQAHGYRAVAEQVFLAVPAQTATTTLQVQAQENGLGLLSVAHNGVAVMTAPAPPLGVAQRQRMLVSERILAAAADHGRVGGTPRH